jgi:hypothetical protein
LPSKHKALISPKKKGRKEGRKRKERKEKKERGNSIVFWLTV